MQWQSSESSLQSKGKPIIGRKLQQSVTLGTSGVVTAAAAQRSPDRLGKLWALKSGAFGFADHRRTRNYNNTAIRLESII